MRRLVPGLLLLFLLPFALAQAPSPARIDLTACPTSLALVAGETGNISAEAHNAGTEHIWLEPTATLRPARDANGTESVGLMSGWRLRPSNDGLDVAPGEYKPFLWKVTAPAVPENAAREVEAVLSFERGDGAPGAEPLVLRLSLVAAHPAQHDEACARSSYMVLPPTPAPPVDPPTKLNATTLALLGVAGAGALLAATRGAWLARRRGQAWWALGALLPLFTRLTASKMLEQDTRQRVYAAIQVKPGVRFSELRSMLALSTGVVDHHVRMLEKAALVTTRKEGRFRAYYPQGVAVPVMSAPPLGETATRLLHRVREGGECSYAELMADLALSKASVSQHVHALEARGLVTLTRLEDGRWVVRPTPRAVQSNS